MQIFIQFEAIFLWRVLLGSSGDVDIGTNISMKLLRNWSIIDGSLVEVPT